MLLTANLPAPLRLDRTASDLLPSLSDLGILERREARRPSTPMPRLSQINTSFRTSPSFRESDREQQDIDFAASPKADCGQPDAHKTIVRLPSFSELEAKIALAEPEWLKEQRSMERRSSCESNCSAPSLAGSDVSSPVSSPRTPLDGHFSFNTPSHQLPAPLPQYGSKFQLGSTSEYLLAQAKGFDSRQLRRPSWPVQAMPFRHPRYSPPLPPPQSSHHTSSGLFSDEALRRGERGAVSKKSPKTPHINKEYTLEQNLWIIYNHVDMKKPWKEVEDEFGRYFGIKVKRTDGGLQSTYYRWNEECPVIDDNGLLEYGEGDGFNKWDVRTHKAKVRGYGKISLIDRYASEVVEANYSWILPHDMARAQQLAARRRPYREAYEARKKARLAQLMNCA